MQRRTEITWSEHDGFRALSVLDRETGRGLLNISGPIGSAVWEGDNLARAVGEAVLRTVTVPGA